ncbi:hypothetical protein ACSBR1_021200 [Camellia fascicularis]
MAASNQTILVTGGAGFIGTHTALQLLKQGFKVAIIDNVDNSVGEAVDRGDLRNKEDLEKLFSQTKFDAVIHFAGLKDVGESVIYPLRYFDNNLIGSINLYQTMAKYNYPKGIPNNLMPYIQQVAVGRLPELNVYGHDYPTPDGTAVCRFH